MKTYLQLAILLTCRKQNMTSVIGAGTVEDIHGSLPSDFEEYKRETIRRALKTLLSRGYINTGLKIGHKNSYYLSSKGYKETEKAGEKNVQG